MDTNESSLRCTAPTAVHRYLTVLEAGTKMMYVVTNKGVRYIGH